MAPRDLVEDIRTFNRFYTKALGTLEEGLLGSSLSLTQARVLYELAQGETSAAELGRRLGLDPSYLCRILADYEGRGWLARSSDPEDARRSRLALTPAGREAFTPLDEASRNQLSQWLEPMAEEDRKAMVAAMGTVQRLLEGAPKKAPMVVLRGHRPGDMGWIVEAQTRLYTREYGWNGEFEALVAGICARFLERFDPAREHCWIAEADGERMGSVTLVAKSKTVAQLRMLFVEPQARGLGLGSKLVEECLAFARRAGYKKMILWTNDCLHAARKIYEGNGFRLAKSEAHHSFGHDLVGQYWEKTL